MARYYTFIGIPIAAFFAWLLGTAVTPASPEPAQDATTDTVTQVTWQLPSKGSEVQIDQEESFTTFWDFY